MVTLSKRRGLNFVQCLIICFVLSGRVRAISVAMGLTPVMWTRISPMATFDTGGIHSYSFFSKFEYKLRVFQQTSTLLATLPLHFKSFKIGNTLWTMLPTCPLVSSFLNMTFSNRRLR